MLSQALKKSHQTGIPPRTKGMGQGATSGPSARRKRDITRRSSHSCVPTAACYPDIQPGNHQLLFSKTYYRNFLKQCYTASKLNSSYSTLRFSFKLVRFFDEMIGRRDKQ